MPFKPGAKAAARTIPVASAFALGGACYLAWPFTNAYVDLARVPGALTPLLNVGTAFYFLPAALLPCLWVVAYWKGRAGLFALFAGQLLLSNFYPGPIRPFWIVVLPGVQWLEGVVGVLGMEGAETLLWAVPVVLLRAARAIMAADVEQRAALAFVLYPFVCGLLFAFVFVTKDPRTRQVMKTDDPATDSVRSEKALLWRPDAPVSIQEVLEFAHAPESPGVAESPDLMTSPSNTAFIVLPESSLRGGLDERDLERLERRFAQTGRAVLLQSRLFDSGRRFNSALFFSKGVARKDKTVLFPFFESEWPALDPDSLSGPAALPARGPDESFQNSTAFTWNGQAFGVLICLESIQSWHRFIRPETRFMIELSDDRAFARGAVAGWHFRFARLRSIESGVALLRVARGGYSGWVDSDGSSQAEVRGESGTVQVRGGSDRSFYFRNRPGVAIVAFYLAYLEFAFILGFTRVPRREFALGLALLGASCAHSLMLAGTATGIVDILWHCNLALLLLPGAVVWRLPRELIAAIYLWGAIGIVLFVFALFRDQLAVEWTSYISHLSVPLGSLLVLRRRGFPWSGWLFGYVYAFALWAVFVLFHPMPDLLGEHQITRALLVPGLPFPLAALPLSLAALFATQVLTVRGLKLARDRRG